MAPRRVLDRRAVASGARWVQLCRHPDGQAVGVCWAFTQEEPVCWAHPAGGRIQLRVPDVAGVLQDIHPGGREYLASTEWDEDAVAAGAPEALERATIPTVRCWSGWRSPGCRDGSVERWTLAQASSGAVDHRPSCA